MASITQEMRENKGKAYNESVKQSAIITPSTKLTLRNRYLGNINWQNWIIRFSPNSEECSLWFVFPAKKMDYICSSRVFSCFWMYTAVWCFRLKVNGLWTTTPCLYQVHAGGKIYQVQAFQIHISSAAHALQSRQVNKLLCNCLHAWQLSKTYNCLAIAPFIYSIKLSLPGLLLLLLSGCLRVSSLHTNHDSASMLLLREMPTNVIHINHVVRIPNFLQRLYSTKMWANKKGSN